jgi:hypothetical protein
MPLGTPLVEALEQLDWLAKEAMSAFPQEPLYREAAEQVRQLARQARLTDIRGDLLELAAKFERLAANADAAIRLGPRSSPHGDGQQA